MAPQIGNKDAHSWYALQERMPIMVIQRGGMEEDNREAITDVFIGYSCSGRGL
jgi:hypothetical protein